MPLSETDGPFPAALLVFPPLLALGLLLLAASAVSPSRVPWPAISRALYVHRPGLAVVGVEMILLAFLALTVAASL